MCPSVESLRYVVRRACALYQTWEKCGIRGLRQIVCSRYRPADGVEIYGTEFYPEGLPSEDPARNAQLDAGKDQKLIGTARAEPVTDDAEFDRRIRLAAHVKGPASLRRNAGPAPINPNYKPIGPVEIARAVQELHEKRARHELFGNAEENQ